MWSLFVNLRTRWMINHNAPLIELPFGYPGSIFRSPMPFGPYDRLSQTWRAYRQQNIAAVVVLTEPHEYLVHARRDLPAFYQEAQIDTIHLPIKDFHVPDDLAAFELALDEVVNRAQAGDHIAVHCLAGLGRTGIFLACLAKHHLNYDGRHAIQWVRKYIPSALENPAQEQFVIEF